jgi:hypothetical protein
VVFRQPAPIGKVLEAIEDGAPLDSVELFCHVQRADERFSILSDEL